MTVSNPAQVALEEALIGDVEADQRHEEADVCLGQPVASEEVAAVAEASLERIAKISANASS